MDKIEKKKNWKKKKENKCRTLLGCESLDASLGHLSLSSLENAVRPDTICRVMKSLFVFLHQFMSLFISTTTVQQDIKREQKKKKKKSKEVK